MCSFNAAPSPDTVLENWTGMIDNSFSKTIRQTFNLSEDDDYVYKSEGFAMPLAQIQSLIDGGTLKYKYRTHDGVIPIPPSDITAYTNIFTSTSDPPKALKSFSANAKKGSPRSNVADYLIDHRYFPEENPNPSSTPASTPSDSSFPPLRVPKKRKPQSPFPNPYLSIWTWSCHETGFVGPLPGPDYSNPDAARQTHPILPVLYHHFGCLCPTWEALKIIEQLTNRNPSARDTHCTGILDVGSGSGYWTYLLRRLNIPVTAIDNSSSSYRYTWITDTIITRAISYLRTHAGCPDKILLLVYPITSNNFTKSVLREYRGDTIVICGTMNENRFTALPDQMIEEWFQTEMGPKGWRLSCRIALPSFVGKDEGMFVWRKGGEGR